MKREKISETIQNIKAKHVDEATVYNGENTAKRKKTWIKWSAVAACLIICVALFLSIGREYVKLDNGDILVFNASTNIGSGMLVGNSSEVRDLSKSEIKSLFKDLPVTWARVMYNPKDGNILNIKGYINGKTLLIATPNYGNTSVVLPGWSSLTSKVNGISVEAGYIFSGQNVLYYAEFKLGENTVYIEHSGLKEENDTVKKEIADMIERLTELGEIDLNIIKR